MWNNIKVRYDKKLNNLKIFYNCLIDVVDKNNWVVNFFKKLFFFFECLFLEKGLKFVLMLFKIFFKDFVVEVEVFILYLFDEFKD